MKIKIAEAKIEKPTEFLKKSFSFCCHMLKPRTTSLRMIVLLYDNLPEILTVYKYSNQSQSYSELEFDKNTQYKQFVIGSLFHQLQA